MHTSGGNRINRKSKKKYRKKSDFRIWSKEIEKAIKGNNTHNYFVSKEIVRETHSELWDKLISTIENDIYGKQAIRYKLMEHNKQE